MRSVQIDTIKGLMIIFMVIGHITLDVSWYKTLHTLIYSFHMPIFLIISGMFFNKDKSTILRITRMIGLPYFVFCTIYLVSLSLVHSFGIKTNTQPISSLGEYAITIFSGGAGSFWFLFTLIVIQIVLRTTQKINNLINGDELSYKVLMLLIFSLIFSINGIDLKIENVVYFLIGYYFIPKGIVDRATVSRHYLIYIVGILLLAINYHNILSFSFFKISYILLLFNLLQQLASQLKLNGFVVKTISLIGRNSLLVLVFHVFFLLLFKPFYSISLQIDPSGISYLLFTTIGSVIGSIIAGVLIDKSGVTKYLFGVPKIFRVS